MIRLALPMLLIAIGAPALARDGNALPALQQIAAADANHDGNTTRDELIAFRAANFQRLDRDGDGFLTRSDIPDFVARLRPELDFNRLLSLFDADHDGRVSYREFVNGPTPYFDLADANRDNVVTAAELKAAMAAAKR